MFKRKGVKQKQQEYRKRLEEFVYNTYSGRRVLGTVLRAYVRAAHEPLWRELMESYGPYWAPWEWGDRFDRWMASIGVRRLKERNRIYYEVPRR